MILKANYAVLNQKHLRFIWKLLAFNLNVCWFIELEICLPKKYIVCDFIVTI